MSQEAWPTPADDAAPRHSREPLPRVEDLPIAEEGYDPQSVRAAFDSFYRHAAQLDASLRTIEAVDSFHRQAAALRADLRALRTAGWTQQSWSPPPTHGYGARSPREGISPAVWRIAAEAAFIIAVAVALGVAKLTWWVIVLVMAGAWLIVGLVEWLASRDYVAVRAAPPAPVHPVVDAEPAEPAEEGEPIGWAAYEEAQEPSDAMTMIGAPPAVAEAEQRPAEPEDDARDEPAETPDPEQVEPSAAVGPPEPQPEDEERPRRRWWTRRTDGDAAEPDVATGEPPRHVRVLAVDEADAVSEPDVAPEPDAPAADAIDPWEQGFDDAELVPEDLEPEAADDEPDERTDESQAALSAELEPPSRRRFRRR